MFYSSMTIRKFISSISLIPKRTSSINLINWELICKAGLGSLRFGRIRILLRAEGMIWRLLAISPFIYSDSVTCHGPIFPLAPTTKFKLKHFRKSLNCSIPKSFNPKSNNNKQLLKSL
jgi:hypothetical protein